MIQTPKQEDDHAIDRKHSVVEMATSAAVSGLCVGVLAQVGQAVMSMPSEMLESLAVGGWTTLAGGAVTALAQRHHISNLEYDFINKYGTPQEIAQGQELQAAHKQASAKGAAGYGMIAASVVVSSQMHKAIGHPTMQAVSALALVSAAAVAAYPLVSGMIKHRRQRQHLAEQVAKQGNGSVLPNSFKPKA